MAHAGTHAGAGLAKTYAQRAPHWYIVAGKTPGISYADFAHAGRVVWAFGEPGKFRSMTQLYLYSEDHQLKYWCMWSRPFRGKDATGINMAHLEPRLQFTGSVRLRVLDGPPGPAQTQRRHWASRINDHRPGTLASQGAEPAVGVPSPSQRGAAARRSGNDW